jgi:hypothetical protein
MGRGPRASFGIVGARTIEDMTVDMTEDDSTARLDLWWQDLTEDQRAQFHDLEAGDPFPQRT